MYKVTNGGDTMKPIDLDNLTEESVYEAFNVDGNEHEALNDSYLGGLQNDKFIFRLSYFFPLSKTNF